MDKRIFSKIKSYIFDLDGTLLDSMSLWDKVYAAPFTLYSIDMPSDYLLKVNHLGLDDCVKYTLQNTALPCDGEKLKEIWWKYSFAEYANSVPLKEGAEELLRYLHSRGARLAVATALPYSLFVPCLKRLRIFDLFDIFVSTDETSRGKDSPEIYLKAATRLDASPSECAVFEDSHIGIASARSAGFYTIGVFDKASEKYSDFITENCDLYIKSLKEITQKLK